MTRFVSLRTISLTAALAASLGGCVVDLEGGSEPGTDETIAGTKPWSQLRAERQATLDAYLAAHSSELEAFLHAPMTKTGTPTLLLRNFPAVFPDIYGTPDENFGPVGFGADPFRAGATLPLGLAPHVAANGLELATVSCAGCHVGRVIGPDGREILLIGAPNTRFNQFRSAITNTVRDPRYLAAFGENALTVGFRDKVLQFQTLIDSTMGAFTYNPLRFPNAPDPSSLDKPGFLDALSIGVAPLTIPELLDPNTAAQIVAAVMPPAPAQVDIMSIWRQSARASAQWDGSIVSPVYRNLAAELGVAGDPTQVQFGNAQVTARFAAALPPPPYPFDVNMGKAKAGEQLFARYCGGCHYDGNPTIYPVSRTRTDANRSLTVTAEGRRRLIGALRAACADPADCNVPDGEIIRDLDSGAGRGYTASPLDGIWARAPYLHNGSVPTLHHLLVPKSRPATFLRGSLRYDRAMVGFVWDSSAATDPYTHVFDSSEAGGANTGHDDAAFNGIDWSKRPDDLANLLEYMKTL